MIEPKAMEIQAATTVSREDLGYVVVDLPVVSLKPYPNIENEPLPSNGPS